MSEQADGEPGMRKLVKLKKTIKRHNKEYPAAVFHLISVPCMNLCPKGGVIICLPATQSPVLSVIRNESDLDSVHRRA
jgi:hypothetical protein